MGLLEAFKRHFYDGAHPQETMITSTIVALLVLGPQKKPLNVLTKAQVVEAIHKALPVVTKAEEKAILYIVYKESTFRVSCRNPRSTSHGLNGFLNSTWRNMTSRHGIRHSLDPVTQIKALWHYCNDRYGGVIRGANYHRRHHNY